MIDTVSAGAAATATAFGVAVIAWLDYWTGSELRIYPLYYLPIAFTAWRLKRTPALVVSTACGLAWLVSNQLAGMRAAPLVWIFNVTIQTLSFIAIGYCFAALRWLLQREEVLGRTDAATSLLNRRGFYDQAQIILDLSRRYRHWLTLAYIDLDNFKAVNDTLGHAQGDDMLRAIADSIRSCSRRGDIVGRLGGDEFALLLPETGPEAAHFVLERLRALVAQRLASSSVPVTTSIGAVAALSPPDNLDALLMRADSAMYAVKAGGKNRLQMEIIGES